MNPARHRVRAVHGVGLTLVLWALGSGYLALRLAPPVPVEGVPAWATWGVVLLLASLIALVVTRLLADAGDRIAAALLSVLVLSVMAATSIPNLVCVVNAGLDGGLTLPSEEHMESLVSLKEIRTGKHQTHWELTTRSHDGQTIHQRHISRALYDSLRAQVVTLHQPLRIEVAQGWLGWPHVQRIRTEPVCVQ